MRLAALSDFHIGARAGMDEFRHDEQRFLERLARVVASHDRVVLVGDIYQTDHALFTGPRAAARQLQLARRRLPRDHYNFGAGGAETETTLRRNRKSLDRLAIAQNILVDVRQVDLSTRLVGVPLSWPVAVAPMGGLILFHPEGDVEMARGASQADTLQFLSGATGWPVEDVAKAGSGPTSRRWVSAARLAPERFAAESATSPAGSQAHNTSSREMRCRRTTDSRDGSCGRCRRTWHR